MREFGIRDTSRFQPFGSVLSVVEMQQREFQHIRRFAEARAPLEQLWAAHRKQLLCAQASDIKSGPTSITVAHGKIDVLPREVDVMERG